MMVDHYTVLVGDAREKLQALPDESVQTVVTSPPYYGLRDYGHDGQIGLEETPEDYVQALVEVFREVRRVLRDDGTVWVNLGDSYASGGKGGGGSYMAERADKSWQHRSKVNGWRPPPDGLKHKDLIGIPWRVAFALQADGWYLRQDIIWAKPNPIPESVTDRCTKAHEYIFLLTKSPRYFYDAEAVKEPATGWNGSLFHDGKNAAVHPNVGKKRKPAGWDTDKGGHGSFHRNGRAQQVEYTDGISIRRNKRSVWTVSTQPYPGAHFATFPPKLIEPCILAGSKPGDTVLDPFGGSGTTAAVALEHGRRAVLCEISEEYAALVPERINSITDALSQERLFKDVQI